MDNGRNVQLDGKILVDGVFTKKIKEGCAVLIENNNPWTALLNMAKVINNTNNYVILQLIEDGGTFSVWHRSGRIDFVRSRLTFCDTLDDAKKLFRQLYKAKTGCIWPSKELTADMQLMQRRTRFYTILDVDYSLICNEAMVNEDKVRDESLLDPLTQNLMLLIRDKDDIENMANRFDYDRSYVPMGLLSERQIERARYFLSVVKANQDGTNVYVPYALDEYYSNIPHRFEYNHLTLQYITTEEDFEREYELLTTLDYIHVNLRIINENLNDSRALVDVYYANLSKKCNLRLLGRDDDFVQIARQLLVNSPIYPKDYHPVEIKAMFELNRHAEENYLKQWLPLNEELFNTSRHLLWHATSIPCVGAIIQNGLELTTNPDNYFGKGVYFADAAFNAGKYSTRNPPNAIMFLAEVFLGTPNFLREKDTSINAETLNLIGCHSVKGEGKNHPLPNGLRVIDDGVRVALGPVVEKRNSSRYVLLDYDEFVVYKPEQIKLRFLVHLELTTKSKELENILNTEGNNQPSSTKHGKKTKSKKNKRN